MSKIVIQSGALRRQVQQASQASGVVACPDCGNPVSLRAKACPRCGSPQAASGLGTEKEKSIRQQIIATNIAVLILLPLVMSGLAAPLWVLIGVGALVWNIAARAYRWHHRQG
jgi:uncharacterized paraquat-inducible protein A